MSKEFFRASIDLLVHFFRKFGTLELELKNRLFYSLCLSMYGVEVFMNKRNCVSDLKKTRCCLSLCC